MADPAVIFHDVSKTYRMRHQKGRTLKETFLRQRVFQETINALDHVSFETPHGGTLGIIGSNGSGKSTALKLIAGTSLPSGGRVEVNGRVSALLELGAGFHPDFTGRENVFLSGALMGLPRRLIEERFEQIVAFADIGDFIDSPAKTYSSGMYLRLAFAVAVNVDPEILLIDEVFAVGDQSFQLKCMERIDRFKSEGKTIIFVSHSLDAVRSLCERAVWIERGKMRIHGVTEKVIDLYMSAVNEKEEVRLTAEADTKEEDPNRWGTRRGEITGVELLDEEGEPRHTYKTRDKMKIRISYDVKEPLEEPVIGLAIVRGDGVLCFGTNTTDTGRTPDVLKRGQGELWYEFRDLNLLPGDYYLSVSFHNLDQSETFDYLDRQYRFKVLEGPEVEIGLVHMSHAWINWEGRPMKRQGRGRVISGAE